MYSVSANHVNPRGFLRMRVIVAARVGQTDLDIQDVEAVRWATNVKGWEVVAIVADYKSSQAHLWDRPNLRPWVTEPEKLAQYDAIVALKVDRLARADDEGISAMKDWAEEYHKQIWISSAEVHYPSGRTDALLWDAYIRMARQEWQAIRDRYARMQAAKHDAGSFVGRPPWGYVAVKADGIKVIEPTPEGRIWMPRIFAWVAEGKSCSWVAEELQRNGVRSGAPSGKWHESTIAKFIHRTTYSGQRQRAGREALEVEPLVSRTLQDKAIAQLATRARAGRQANTKPKSLLGKANCGNPDCPGGGSWPLYRITNRQGHTYYRCAGRGAQRQGCGAPLIRTEALDSLVLNFTRYWDTRPYKTQRFIAGNDIAERLTQLNAEAAEAFSMAAPKDKMTVAADYAKRIEALEAEGPVQPHWEEVETGETEGQHLQSLDPEGQRDYLAHKDIKAWKDAGGTIHVTIDGVTTQDRSIIGADPHPEEAD